MKNVKKAKPTKVDKKLPGKFSRLFRNKKIVVLVVFVLIFSIAGSYRLYSTSAANTSKPVGTCRNRGVVLRRGSTGACVVTVQKLMTTFKNIRDPNWPNLVVDGNFGPATEAVVRKYQQKEGLTVDGIVGEQTWAALDRACRESYRIYGGVHSGCSYANG